MSRLAGYERPGMFDRERLERLRKMTSMDSPLGFEVMDVLEPSERFTEEVKE